MTMMMTIIMTDDDDNDEDDEYDECYFVKLNKGDNRPCSA